MAIFNEEILRRDFPLDGAHLVAASAGTGKTYNIQTIYSRLIMERGLRVSQIQVMTFTEAATKELRARLHTVLKDLQARLKGEPCEGKDEEEIKERCKRADGIIDACTTTREAMRLGVEIALLEFDGAAISTIHGFCSRALSRYAFETRMTFATEIDDNKNAELSKLARDWWRKREEMAPESLLQPLKLETLQSYVHALGGKADWRLDGDIDTATPTGFLLQAASDIVEAYENDRTNRRTQTYDDLLRSMREALKGPFGKEFAARLREDFKAALIDEFQDTDPVQFDIFRMVFLEDPSLPVFFVGDPKQAIYAFRGGDIFTYRFAAKNMVPENRKYYLDTNFRSTPRLMEAVNRIFRDNGGYTFGDSEIDYAHDIVASEKNGPLLVNGSEDRQPFRIIQVDGSKADLYRSLAQQVVRTLNDDENNLSPKDVAILVSAKVNAKLIQQELQSCSVPCAIQNPGNVFTAVSDNHGSTSNEPSFMLRELYTVFRAMAKIGGKGQVRTALATPFFGLTPADILALDEDGLASWVDKFNEINAIWQKRGLGAAVSKMQEHGTVDGIGYRERLAAMPNGERLLADCGQILELAFAAVKEIGSSPERLIHWMEERVANAAEEDDSEAYARELESEDDAVRIMTMHVSKGLQFKVVFLPDSNVSVREKAGADLFCYHDGQDGDRLVFGAVDALKAEDVDGLGGEEDEEPREEEHVKPQAVQAMKEEEQEKLRLLYVAMTRARQRTVVMYNTNSKTKLEKPLARLMDNARRNGAGEDDGNSPIMWIHGFKPEDVSPMYSPKNASVKMALTPPTAPPKFDLRPARGSYSAISPSASNDSIGDDGKDMDADDGKSPSPQQDAKLPVFQIRGGSYIGSCWHEALEKLPFDADDAVVRSISEKALLDYGFDPQEVFEGESCLDITVGMLSKTLGRRLTSPDGTEFSLRDVGWNERMSELEFNFSSAHAKESTREIGDILRRHWRGDASKQEFLKAIEDWNSLVPNGFMNGFIDLVFRHDGYYYIVDWKSNRFGGDANAITESGVRREMAAHGYFFQYILYSAVLQRYLKDLPCGGYSWERNFGGIRYYFLRGIDAGLQAAVFADRPSEALLDDIGEALGLEVR